MRLLAFLRNFSLMVKFPVTVVGIAILLAATLLIPILFQITSTEIENAEKRVQSFLTACSDGIQPFLHRRDYWAGFDFLVRLRKSQSDLVIKDVLVTDSEGRIFASTDPQSHRILTLAPLDSPPSPEHQPGLWETLRSAELRISRGITMDGLFLGRIHSVVDLMPLRRRIVSLALLATIFTAVITFLCGGVGFLISREMIMPLSRLKDHVEKVSEGEIQFIDERLIHPNDELNQLMIKFNHMAAALLEKERISEQLAVRNQLIALGKLAASMAHEINNPLGGMLNVVNTIRRHGEDGTVRGSSLALLERGIKQVQSIVQAALVTYRHSEGNLNLRPVDLEDIRLLIQNYVRTSKIDLHWQNDLVDELDIPAMAIRQLCLNLLLNACEAMSEGGELHFEAHTEAEQLNISVEDTGGGIPPEVLECLSSEEVGEGDLLLQSNGLGLWICTSLVRQLQGEWKLESHLGHGTRVLVTFPLHGDTGYAA